MQPAPGRGSARRPTSPLWPSVTAALLLALLLVLATTLLPQPHAPAGERPGIRPASAGHPEAPATTPEAPATELVDVAR
ncbi:MAG TPA: hypothetical protein VGE77_14705 [Nocardioides sp.]